MALAPLKARAAPIWAAIVLAGGCSLPNEPTRMPVLPSGQSFVFDVTFFSTHTPDASAPAIDWGRALERVRFVDSTDAPFFAVPRVTFDAAATATPTHNRGEWRWTYATTLDGHAYSGYLRGFPSGSADSWALVVNAPSLSPPINNYVWWEGLSADGGLGGIWVIYQPAFNGVAETVRLDWGVSNTSRSLVLSRVGSVMNFHMGTLWTIEYTSAAATESFRLYWSPTDGTGAVDDLAGDGFQCWDTHQHDVAC